MSILVKRAGTKFVCDVPQTKKPIFLLQITDTQIIVTDGDKVYDVERKDK